MEEDLNKLKQTSRHIGSLNVGSQINWRIVLDGIKVLIDSEIDKYREDFSDVDDPSFDYYD